MTSSAELTFGAVKLLSPNPPWADYAIEATADSTTWGNPAAVVATVASMLMDGEKAKITRFGNREASVPLQIRGATLDAVAAGEAALMAEVNAGRNTLTWLPPGWSTASVFDVVYSTLDFQFDDLAETNQVTRYFTLTLVCTPFARRDTPSTVVADPVPEGDPVVTPIDDCTSETGWSTSDGRIDLTTSGGAIVITANAGGYVADAQVAKSGLSATIPPGSFLVIDWERVGGSGLQFLKPVGGLLAFAAAEQVGDSRQKFYFRVTSPFTGMRVQFDGVASSQAKIHDISQVDRLPVTGTGRQRSFTATVDGTARTTADLVIEADDGLGGEVVVFTAPYADAIDPPLRKWFVDAGVTAAGTVSGRENDIQTPVVAEIPVVVIPPGMHLIVARLKVFSGSARNVDVQWTVGLTASPWSSPDTDVDETITVAMTTDYANYALGVVELPTAAVDPTSGANVLLTLLDPFDTIYYVDDVYLFNLDTGTLTWLSDLTVSDDTPSKVEVRSATIDRDNPAWLVGTTGTDVDTVDASSRATSPGVHEFRPGLMSIFVMTPDAVEQTVSLQLYDRFQHHVTPPET